MFHSLWSSAKKIVLLIGCVLSFFALIEVVRAYEVLRDLHYAVGYAFLLVIMVGLVWGILYYLKSLAGGESRLVRPQEQVGKAYVKYIMRLLGSLSKSEHVSEQSKEQVLLKASQLRDGLAENIEAAQSDAMEAEKSLIEPLVAELEIKAEKEVRACVRDVAVAVAISPWRSVDLFIVVYRNIRMVTSIAKIFRSRVSLRDNFDILNDVLAVVATVNILNFGGRIIQNLAGSTPVVGRWVDDAAQGLGAGLFTSIAGHASVKRSNIYRAYDPVEVQQTIAKNMKSYLHDIEGIVWDAVKAQIPAEMADKMKDAFTKAVDLTYDTVDLFVRRPVVSVGRGVVSVSSKLTNGVVVVSSKAASAVANGVGGTLNFIGAKARSLRKKKNSAEGDAQR